MYARMLLITAAVACCIRTNVPGKHQSHPSMHHSYYGVQASPNIAVHQAASTLNQQQSKMHLPRAPQVTAFVEQQNKVSNVVSTSSNHQPPTLTSAPATIVSDAASSTTEAEEEPTKPRFSMSGACNSASLPWFNVSAYERWRPPVTANGWIDVYVMPYVRRVDDVNENSEEVKITMQGYMIWRDARLRWPNSVCPVQSILVPSAYLWVPVVEITEVRQFISHLIQDNWVTVHNDGTAIMYFSFNALSIRCHLDSSRFPFDTQSCPITFVTFTYENLKDGHSTFAVAEFLDVIAEFGEWGNIEFVPTTPASFHTDTLYAKPSKNTSSLDDVEANNITSELFYQWNNISLTFTFVQYKLSMTRKALQHVIVWVGPVKILYVIGIVGVFSQDGMSIDAGNLLIVISLFLMALIDRLPAGFSSFPVIVMNYTLTFLLYGVAILIGNTIANKHRTPGRFMCALASFHRRLATWWTESRECSFCATAGRHDVVDAPNNNGRKKLKLSEDRRNSSGHRCCSHTPVTRPRNLLQPVFADRANQTNHQCSKPTSLIAFPFIDQDRISPKTPSSSDLQLQNCTATIDCIKQLHEKQPKDVKHLEGQNQKAPPFPDGPNELATGNIAVHTTVNKVRNNDKMMIAANHTPKSTTHPAADPATTHIRPAFCHHHTAALNNIRCTCCAALKCANCANQEAATTHQRGSSSNSSRCCYPPHHHRSTDTDDDDDDDEDDLTISLATFNNNNVPAAAVRQQQHHHIGNRDGTCGCRHQHHHHHHHVAHQHQHPDHQQQQAKHQQQRQKAHEIRSRCACVLCVVFLLIQFVFDLFSVLLWFV